MRLKAAEACGQHHADGRSCRIAGFRGRICSGLFLPDEQFFGWAWRLPFIFSPALLAVGLYIRMQVSEPEAFEEIARKGEIEKPR